VLRRLTDELKTARAQADQRLVDLRAAETAADSRAFRDERERARAQFQGLREGATSARDISSAADAWLAEVDRINALAAAAEARLERARASFEAASAAVEHLTAETDAARQAAHGAEEACAEARRRALDCAEATEGSEAGDAPGAVVGAEPGATGGGQPGESETPGGPTAPGSRRSRSGAAGAPARPPSGPATPPALGPPAEASPIVPRALRPPQLKIRLGNEDQPRTLVERMLAGEPGTLRTVAARLGDDQATRQAWEDRLTRLLDSILQHAVEAAALDVSGDHPFWSTFSAEQSRDIIAALAALGHRYDGTGGWVDDRTPNQRDVALAVAQAGIDPMRVRHWPTLAESASLLADAVILGGDYLFSVAPDLGEEDLREALARDEQTLADVWADWPRLQPQLLATA
jgi:hypothetical protein